MLSFQAGPETHGERLDRFLNEHLQQTRALIQRWIRSGRVTVNDAPCKAGQRLRSGDRILVRPAAPPPMDLLAEALPLQIVFEDEQLVVIDKPPGLVVHPGAGRRTGTLVNALLFHFNSMSRQQGIRPGIVHRIDKDTSGLLVVAKTDRAHDVLARQFKERTVTKLYRCLVWGRVRVAHGSIETPVGRHPTHRTRMSTRTRTPRSAHTEYRVVRRWRDFSYLEVKLHTGRTHQIRVHMESIGHPVAGDPVYSGNRRAAAGDAESSRVIAGLQRQFLHAAVLAFEHPEEGRPMRFESALPQDLAAILDSLE